MKTWFTPFVTLCLTLSIGGYASQFDAVGQCNDGGTLANVESGRYRGRAFDLMAVASFRSKHTALASGESAWVQQLSGPSGPNKSYSNKGSSVVLFSNCKQGACSDEWLAGIVEPAGGTYGLVINQSGETRELGTISALGRAALACLDEKAKESARAVEESIRKPQR